MNVAAELRALTSSLAREEGVFGHVAEDADGILPDLVRRVAAEAEEAWKHFAVQGAVGPDTPAEIADALVQIEAERAVELLTYLAADDLVFPRSERRDRAHARRAAERVVHLLGHEVAWYTNITDLSTRGRVWNPVTRHTFDGVVAGTGDQFTVVLLQVGEWQVWTSAVQQVRVGTDFQGGGRTVGPLPPDVLVGTAPDDTAGSAVVLFAVTKHHRTSLQRATALGTGGYGLGRHPCKVTLGSGGLSPRLGNL